MEGSISERKRKEESIRFTIKKRGADIAAISRLSAPRKEFVFRGVMDRTVILYFRAYWAAVVASVPASDG